MTVIIAHIKGPSGSGKTTIGHIINQKYPFVKNIDTDDIILKDMPCIFPEMYTKYLKMNKLDLFRKKYFSESLFQSIKPYKYVVLVGDVRLKIDENYYNIENINTKNKYVINIDENILIERRFNRHLQFMANNVDHYFKKAKKKPLCIDIDKWINERLYWGHTRDIYYEKTKKEGYLKLSQNEIIDQIKKIINENIQI